MHKGGRTRDCAGGVACAQGLVPRGSASAQGLVCVGEGGAVCPTKAACAQGLCLGVLDDDMCAGTQACSLSVCKQAVFETNKSAIVSCFLKHLLWCPLLLQFSRLEGPGPQGSCLSGGWCRIPAGFLANAVIFVGNLDYIQK